MGRILENYKVVSNSLTDVEKEDFKGFLETAKLDRLDATEVTNIIRFIDGIENVNEMMQVITSLTENNTIGKCKNLDFILKFFESDLRRIADM